MKKFSSIEQFRHVYKTVQYHHGDNMPTIQYVGTVKLHGTNAGLRRINGKLKPQSRTSIIDVSNDNAGFAAWVDTVPSEVFHKIFDDAGFFLKRDVTIFGEWVGPRIQKGTGVNELSSKQWVLFGAYDGEKETYLDIKMDVEAPDYNIYNISRGGFFTMNIDFSNPEETLEKLTELTLKVEEECPYAKSFFKEIINITVSEENNVFTFSHDIVLKDTIIKHIKPIFKKLREKGRTGKITLELNI